MILIEHSGPNAVRPSKYGLMSRARAKVIQVCQDELFQFVNYFQFHLRLELLQHKQSFVILKAG